MRQQLGSLLQVDDMNTVTLGEDVRSHTRVPFVRAMAEVHTAFQKGFHGNNSHFSPYFSADRCARNGIQQNEFSGDSAR
jgi:hypothetical protein